MDIERYRKIRNLFDAALDLDRGERKAFLQEACSGDDQLLADVEQLLAADEEQATSTAPARDRVKAAVPLEGRHVGNYEIVSQLGEGGMGIVYLAEQREPLRRRVALKIMRYGLDSSRVLARFESERQALALMNHPGVAKVFDAGVTEDGRQYFVMEYVPGISITEFCDRRQLPVPERLTLFMQVCNAIHHAHQRACQFEMGNFDQAETVLVRAYRELESTEGLRSSATQTVLRRLIDLYDRRGTPESAAAYRKLRPAIALTDALDLGTLRISGLHPQWDDSLSVALNQRSTWMLWTADSVEPSAGLLDETALDDGHPIMTVADSSFSRTGLLPLTGDESAFNARSLSASCTNDCGFRWFLSPRSLVPDPTRQRALVFYSKLQRTPLGSFIKAGVSLAIWRAGAPVERPGTIEPTLLFGSGEPAWGTAALVSGDFLYTYACERFRPALEMDCILARVPMEQIRIRLADRPEGPWQSQAVLEIETLRPAVGLPFPWIRFATGHPELARENGRVEYLSYGRYNGSRNEIRIIRIEFQ